MDQNTWFIVQEAFEIPSPALLIYVDRIQANLEKMISYVDGDPSRLRPHIKTHKMPQIIKMQIASGIQKFKTATIAESEMVASAGAKDILLAYPLVGPNIDRYIELIRKFPETKFQCVIDSHAGLELMQAALLKADSKTTAYLETDSGMHRTGVKIGPEAIQLYKSISEASQLIPGGIHAYDGHIKEKNLTERIEKAEGDFSHVLKLKQDLIKAGLPVQKLVVGGTPSFPVHAKHEDRECSPGTCVLWDTGYSTKFPDLDFQYAATVLSRVISKPGENLLCFDLGYKAIASDNPEPRVIFPELADAKMVTHSEEHLVLETDKAKDWEIGQVAYGIPWHICPTCALYSHAYVIEDQHVKDKWDVTARARSLSI